MWPRLVGGIVFVTAGCAAKPAIVVATPTKLATGFVARDARLPDGSTRRFSVFLPHDYSPDRRWPTVVFLQGLGEGGTDGKKQTSVGLGPYVRKHGETFECIVVFPQSGGLWSSNDADAISIACLDDVERAFSVDAARVYLTGISTGGFGVWKIGAAHANRFAALAPLCARTGEAFATQLAPLPIWAFHNAYDPIVWSSATRDTVDAINRAGGHARLTIYKSFAHDCWTRTYRDPAFWAWLLAQRKS